MSRAALLLSRFTLLLILLATSGCEVLSTDDPQPDAADIISDASDTGAERDAAVDTMSSLDTRADMEEDVLLGVVCDDDSDCALEEFCDFAVERCAPDVCDPTENGGEPYCLGLEVVQCRDNGEAVDVKRSCMAGRACRIAGIPGQEEAQCVCIDNGDIACESPLLGADIYEVDSCGNRLQKVDDCIVGLAESCIDDERGVQCRTPEVCSESSNCANGDYCKDGRCVPDVCEPPPISNPNSRRFCDGNVVRVCAEDGSGFVDVEDCTGNGVGEVCLTLPSDPGADCRCVPAGVTCHDTDVWAYNSCGVYTSRMESCDGSFECVQGPAGPDCEVWTPCSVDSQCGAGRVCYAGSCASQLCSPGSERCAGGAVERCDARGVSWQLIDQCAVGETCNASGGLANCGCSPAASQGCALGDVYAFDSCGARGALVTDCGADMVCVNAGGGPTCIDPDAAPQACLGDLECDNGEVCIEGACAPPVCAAGSLFCEAGATRRCDASGTGSALVADCAGGQVCSEASGEARCLCAPDARLGCLNGDVYSFDSCGDAGSIVDDCADDCNENGNQASCVSQVEVPPEPSCTAQASMECYQGDLYWFDSCGVANTVAEACPGAVTCNTIGGPAACRSSVADENSPYWDRSCPLVQDIELPTELAADCRCFVNRTPSSGIDRCTGALYIPISTQIGEGPSIRSLPQSEYNGGVIVGREVILGVGWSSSSYPDQGLVMAINLDDGARRIVSGAFEDPSTGVFNTGAGPDLSSVIDVKQGPDGDLYALSVPATSPDLEIVRVDPTSGDRVVVWRGRDAAYGQCGSGDAARLSVTYHPRVFEVNSDGAFYLAFRGAGYYSEGVGIVQISADGSSCDFVTRSGAGGLNAYSGDDIGGGYMLDRGYYSGLTIHDGQLYVLNDVYKALFRIDPTTGNRARLSSASTSWGLLGAGPTNFGGIGQRWLTWDASRSIMWASGLIGYRGLTAVDLTTGDRTEAYCRSSNAIVPWRETCLGGVLEGGYQDEGGFWIDPVNGDPILVHEAHGLVRVDLLNGNSMRFSF